MASRLDLQTFLEELLESKNVYFQPPESVKMKYPAIVYALDDIENVHADNGVYSSHRHYSVTVIDSDPDSELVGKVVADRKSTRLNSSHRSQSRMPSSA